MELDNETLDTLGFREPWDSIERIAFDTRLKHLYNGRVTTEEPCKGCGKEDFNRRPNGILVQFCSNQCYKDYDKENKRKLRNAHRPEYCESCNTQLPPPVIKSNGKLSKPRRFCSTKCKDYAGNKRRREAKKAGQNRNTKPKQT